MKTTTCMYFVKCSYLNLPLTIRCSRAY